MQPPHRLHEPPEDSQWQIRPARAAIPPDRHAPIQRLARLHGRDLTIRHNRKTTDAADNDQMARVASGNAVEYMPCRHSHDSGAHECAGGDATAEMRDLNF